MQIIDLGFHTNESIDIKPYYNNYQNLTNDNFFFSTYDGASISSSSEYSRVTSLSIALELYSNYNSSTGILRTYLKTRMYGITLESYNRQHLFLIPDGKILTKNLEKYRVSSSGDNSLKFNLSSLSGYNNLTLNDFYAINNASKFTSGRSYYSYPEDFRPSGYSEFLRSYDASTGILTFGGRVKLTSPSASFGYTMPSIYLAKDGLVNTYYKNNDIWTPCLIYQKNGNSWNKDGGITKIKINGEWQ